MDLHCWQKLVLQCMKTNGSLCILLYICCILHSPTDPCGVHLQSICSPWSPPGLHMTPPPVLLQCPPLHSSWSPQGVHMEWIGSGLDQMEGVNRWSPGGVHKDCAEMLNKMHPQRIEHTISCTNAYISNSHHWPLDHQGLKYLTNGFPICYISPNFGNVSKK